MKRIFTILTMALVCGALSCPSIQARGRQTAGNNGTNGTTQQAPARTDQRPSGGTQARPGGNAQTRPSGGTQGRPGGNAQARPNSNPNRNNNSSAVRPGAQTNRPGNSSHSTPATQPSRPGGNRPDNRPNGGHQPDHQPGHQPGHQPVPNGPGHGHGNFGPGHQGPRPYHEFGMIPHRPPYVATLPPPRPWSRPVPPPAFRPGPRYPVISTILGITLGTALDLTLNYLFDGGYYITGYTPDAVYLSDVRQLNMLWPNATLYYHGGRLAGSEFVYSTPYYDSTRYYNTYNRLVNAYGLPVSRVNLPGGGFECSWFGYDGQYVTLQYVGAVAANGLNRYYTTLSFGN